MVDLQLVQNCTNMTMEQINPHSFRRNHTINIILYQGRNKKNTSYRFSGKYSYLNICQAKKKKKKCNYKQIFLQHRKQMKHTCIGRPDQTFKTMT